MSRARLFIYSLSGILLLCIACLYLLLRASLPALDGEVKSTYLSDAVTVKRDALGSADIFAQSREDLAFATGYVHGQERFFQMDLMRRNAAGELAELVGQAALPLDKKRRLHQFRLRAEKILPTLPQQHRQLLANYAAGVNQGIHDLSMRPFEYLLLNQAPIPWQAEDSLLVIYSMYLQLQYSDGKRDISVDALHKLVPEQWFDFLMASGSRWDAPLDDSIIPEPSLPTEPLPAQINQRSREAFDQPGDLQPGSNNFAVAGSLTRHGGAMLANDMHLNISVPNIWYRMRLNWQDADQRHFVVGVSLPGTPMVIAGSNGKLAWGFTNTQGDWSDVIRLTVSPGGEQYLTESGWQAFSYQQETINIAGQDSEPLRIKHTEFGPVIGVDAQGNPLALRWVAHDPRGVNLQLMQIETATSVTEGVRIAHQAGMPAQNIMLADASGNIGWTVAGPIPAQPKSDNRLVVDSHAKDNRWQGFIPSERYPQRVNPVDGRLWTANARTLGDEFAVIGDGGLALGARAQQIRDGLRSLPQIDEKDLFAIQLDDRALFLSRWHDLLLQNVIPGADFAGKAYAIEALQNWQARASAESLGYLLTREFRLKVRHLLFSPLFTAVQQQEPAVSAKSLYAPLETAMWALVSEQPKHLLPGGYDNWQQLLQQAWLATLTDLNQQTGNWQTASWGTYNQSYFQHPLGKVIDTLAPLTNMPSVPQAGDSFMPRVATNSFGASERLVVAPGQEQSGILSMPSAQSGHPLSPYYFAGETRWQADDPVPLLPGKTVWQLEMLPGTN